MRVRYVVALVLLCGCKSGKSITISSGGGLTFSSCALLQKDRGQPRDSKPYHPGDDIFARCDVAGAKPGPDGKVNISYKWRMTDDKGKEVTPPLKGLLRDKLGDGHPILTFHLPLSKSAPAGSYKLETIVRDEIEKHEAAHVQTLTIALAGK